jgi:hypothetical protein
MYWGFKQLACRIGKHDLFLVRKISNQAGQVECNTCHKQWSMKFEGDNQGAMIPWETASKFYTEKRIKDALS